MKLALAAATVMIPLTVATQVSFRRLLGCASAEAIRTGLAKLHSADWRSLSLEQVRSMWPTELAGKDCDPAGCRDVWAMDRIISGQCECCAVFDFMLQGTATTPQTEWLNDITIIYSVAQRARAVDLARSFAGALGARAADVQSIGAASVQSFDWETASRRGPELSSIEVRIQQQSDRWEIHLNGAQNVPK